MPSLVLGIRYLTGYAVATDPTNRDIAEWPPHPGRVFMALAAAYFETGEDVAERATLEWLESLPAPSLHAPEADPRTVVTHFVPVNDTAGPSKAPLQSAPDFTRDRAGRTFPRVRLRDDQVYLTWNGIDVPERHRTALQGLCAKVTRVGHSSSLVQMWMADEVNGDLQQFDPDSVAADQHLRIVSPGTLQYLLREYNGTAIENFARLSDAILGSRGKEQLALKEEFERTFGLPWRKSLQPPENRRPVLGLWQGYRAVEKPREPPARTVFDPALIVLRLAREDSRYEALELVTSLRVADTLRKAVQRVADQDLQLGIVPEVLSGHRHDGKPSERPHAAFIPLGFVGDEHADGHLLGIGIALPRKEHWPNEESERRIVMTILTRVPHLTLGPLGVWTLTPELRETPPRALIPEIWTGAPRGAMTWASVTPVVFDEHPKEKERVAYLEAVGRMVRAACVRVGLPEPVNVDVSPVSWHLGAPVAKDFPRLTRKDGSERRHLHIWLEFAQPVVGPIILGAGRYRGYGLCRPLLRKSGVTR